MKIGNLLYNGFSSGTYGKIFKVKAFALIVVLLSLLFTNSSFGQVIGATQTRNASSFGAGANITITGGGTLNMDAPLTITSLTTTGANNSNITGNNILTINGPITLDPGNNNNNTLVIGAAVTVSTNSIAIVTGNPNSRYNITVSGILKNSGTTGALSSLICNIGSTVEYNGTAQTVYPTTYSNLTLSGSGSKTISGSTTVAVNSVLSMQGTSTTIIGGTLAYGTASTLEYKGSAAQITGNEFISPFPGSGGVVINNANGVTLNAAKSVGANPFTIGSTVANSEFFDGGFQLTSTGVLNLTSGTLNLGSGNNATNYPAFSTNNFSTNATVNYNSTAAQTIVAINYQNLTNTANGPRTLASSLIIGVRGVFQPSTNTNTITGSTVSFNGTTAQTIPAYNYNNLTVTNNSANITLANSGIIRIAGVFTPNATSFGTITSSTISFNGTAAQNIPTFTFNNLNINNTSGSANGVTLNGNISVDQSLSLINGLLKTGTYKVTIVNGGSSNRTTGWVVGNMEKYIGSTGVVNFEIGGNENYRPVSLNFTDLTTPGYITATVTLADGNHPAISTSGLDATKTLKRYYTLSSPTVAGVYNATFNFVAADVPAGANTNFFVVREYNNPSWLTTTNGTRTGSSTQALGLTNFRVFAIGPITGIPVATPPSNATICAGNNATFTSTSSSVPPPTVKWQRSNDGTTWEDITSSLDGGIYSNFTTTTLNVTNAPVEVSGYRYMSVFTNINGAGSSTAATLTVTAVPDASISYAATQFSNSVNTAQAVTRTGSAGGTYSAAPAGLSINTSTGAIIPSSSTLATYTVTYTIAAAGGCAAYTTTTQVTITTAPTATFSYTGNPFCKSFVGDRAVSMTGTGDYLNGTFSATPGGLVIDPTSGTITPSSSTAGTYTVNYHIPARGIYAASDYTTSVTITNVPTAAISYSSAQYCNSDNTPNSVSLTGTNAYTGGIFTASPAGLIIDAATGAITPTGSPLNTYTVTYTIPASGGCAAAPVTTQVEIIAGPAASLTYGGNPFCKTISTAQAVTRTGATNGTYSSTTGLNINTSTGDINPSLSDAGTYTVLYTIPAAGQCGIVQVSTSVTITEPAEIEITYPGQPYCNAGANKAVQSTAAGAYIGGTFSASPAGLIFAANGAINAAASQPGTYTVTYTSPNVGGCTVQATTVVEITAAPVATINYSASAFCLNVGEAQPVTLTGDQSGTFSAAPAGLSINSENGEITPSNSNAGSYTVTYTIAASGTCGAITRTLPITITAPPTVNISYTGTPFCKTLNNANVTRTGTNAYTTGTYSASSPNLSLNTGTGAINPSLSIAGTYTVTYTLNATGGCGAISDEATVVITNVPTVDISYAGPFCKSEISEQTVTMANGVGAYQNGAFTSTTGLSINSVTGDIIPANSSPGTYTVTYTIPATAGCGTFTKTTSVTIIDIVGTPTAITVSAGTQPNCQIINGTTTTTYATTAINSTSFTWSLSNLAAGTINATSGVMTWSNGFAGTTDIIVVANGCNGGSAEISRPVTITPTVSTPTAITVSAGTEPTCQLINGSTTTTYATTATNSTSFTWSSSNSAAGIINATTGVMTWANGFAGTTDIRVVANGCNGPTAQVVRTVTITPTVGTPTAITVSAGTQPTCQLVNGTTTTTYATTATNSTSFTWSLSNAAAGTINATTGVITWTSGFAGTTDIRVVAIGCNGPSAQVVRTVSITPSVGTPTAITVSAGAQPTCQLINATTTTTYATTATNATSYTWSLSNPAAGTLNPTTGVMTWANGFAGTTDIRVVANGCNGASAQVVRTVTINQTVGKPNAIAVSAGTEPVCKIATSTTTTYSTTASNLSPTTFTWSVSNTAAGSMNASTGVMTWTVGFTGTVNIQVVANGCNGPSVMTTRTVTFSPPPAPVILTTTPITCLGDIATLTASSYPATPVIDEDFQSSNPEGWTFDKLTGGLNASSNNGDKDVWGIAGGGKTFFGATFNSPNGGKYAVVYGPNPSFLYSPIFSTAGMTSASLQFYHALKLNAGDAARIEISLNGNSGPWTTLKAYPSPTTVGVPNNGFVLENIDLAAYLGYTNLKFRWVFTSTSNSYWAVDEIVVDGPYQPVSNTWSPATGLYTNPTATTPYNGTDTLTTVYVKPSAVGTTNYTITSTSASGCTTTTTFALVVNPLATLGGVSTTAVCSGTNATITLSGLLASSTSTVNFDIANGAAQTASVVANSAGVGSFTIPVTIINNGQVLTIRSIASSINNGPACAQTFASNNSVSLIVNPVPVVNSTTAVTCHGALYSFTPSSSVANTVYTWGIPTYSSTNLSGGNAQSAQTSFNQTLLNSGTTSGTATYTITPSANGCIGNTFTITITVNLVPVLTTTVTYIDACPGANTPLEAIAPGTNTYLWTPATNISNTSVNNPTVNPIVTTTYTVVASTNGTACNDTATFVITVPNGTAGSWTGLKSTDWFHCLNWADGNVPTSATNVVIGNVPNPVELNIGSAFGSAFSFTANANNLTVTNNSLTVFASTALNVGGNFNSTAGTFNASVGTLNLTGNSAQTFSTKPADGTPVIFNFGVSGTGAKTLNNNLTISNVLTLTNGILNVNGNILSITNVLPIAVVGGSSTSFINGAVRWTLPANVTDPAINYVFPVGKGTNYLPFSLNNPKTGTTGPVIEVEAFNGSTGGTFDGTVSALSNTEYWHATALSGNLLDTRVSLGRQAGLGTLDAIAISTTGALAGPYTSLAGSVSGTNINFSNVTGNLGYFVMAVAIPLPVITDFVSNNPIGTKTGYTGSIITITGTNLGATNNVTINGVAATSISNISNTQVDATVGVGLPLTGFITLTTGAGTASTAPITFTYLGYITKAGGNWGAAGPSTTWLGDNAPLALPTVLANITLAHNVTMDVPVTLDSNLILQGGNLALASQTLTLNNGLIRNSNALTGSKTANLVIGATYKGQPLFFDQTAANGNFLNSLTINRNVTLDNTLNIAPALDNDPNSGFVKVNTGVLNSNGNLVLVSDATGTARVAENTSGAPYIIGDATVQRFIHARRAWRLVTAPIDMSSNVTINKAWQEGLVYNSDNGTTYIAGTTTVAPVPSLYGTHITGGTAAYPNSSVAMAVGFDHGVWSGTSSIRIYSGGNWTATVPNGPLNTNIKTYRAYMLFSRGDRTVNPADIGTPAKDAVVRAKGLLGQNAQDARALTTNNFSLMGNPFPSPIDFEKMYTESNVLAPSFLVWDSRLEEFGAYRLVTRTGVNTFTTTPYPDPAAQSTPALEAPQHIQSGQGFFIKRAGTANVNLVIKESHKSANTKAEQLFSRNAKMFQANLNKVTGTNTATIDGVTVAFNDQYDETVNTQDDEKMYNFNENLSIRRSGKDLMQEFRPNIKDGDTLYLRLWRTTAKTYQLVFKATNLGDGSLSANLHDRYLKKISPINLDGSLERITFTVTADAESKRDDRFIVVFSENTILPVHFTSVKANLVSDKVAVEWNVATEAGTLLYEVEKSANGIQFNSGYTVNALNNPSGNATYNWLDAAPVAGYNYYRIKSVAQNGETKYSMVVRVNMVKGGKSAMAAYPNPLVGQTVSVQLSNLKPGNYTLNMYNSLGQVVFSKVISHGGGTATQTLQFPNRLSKGVYQLKLVGVNEVDVQHLTVQ